ncbi:hypothetical protein AC621_10365 [Bacillus sp. FJAT-27445]|nr:hypothetical protein AC621_10365 [Bacillus sp. FJAT-27445]
MNEEKSPLFTAGLFLFFNKSNQNGDHRRYIEEERKRDVVYDWNTKCARHKCAADAPRNQWVN